MSASTLIDGDSPAIQLCAAGMAVDGDPAAAYACFLRAWEVRRDAYEASIVAHFLARHQPTPADALRWNQTAVDHAEEVPGDRAHPLLASLYLNLGASYLEARQLADAAVATERGLAALRYLPDDGYRAFVARGLERLRCRLETAAQQCVNMHRP